MKKGILLFVTTLLFFASQLSYADNSSSSFSAITSCDSYKQENTNKTLSNIIKNISNVSLKLAMAKKYIVVMKVRGARCLKSPITINNTGIQVFEDPNFFTFANTGVLKSFTASQKKEIQQRVIIYQNSFFKTVNELIERKFLTKEDKDLMKGKVTLQYIANCHEFDGKISLKQWYNANKEWVRNELIGFNINVNICFEPRFNQDLESSVNQIMAHELGHFFYYFHDKTPKKFEALCWVSGVDTPVCAKKSFVSEYAMSSAEEDYAESFAFWFLKKLVPGKDPQLNDKKKYFDGIANSL